MTLTKTVIELTVLHDTPLAGRSMEEIGREIDIGDWLGSWVVVRATTVPPEKMAEESIALGNDGDFFTDLLPTETV